MDILSLNNNKVGGDVISKMGPGVPRGRSDLIGWERISGDFIIQTVVATMATAT